MDSPQISEAWNGFKPGIWEETIDVRDFIQQNYTPYEDGSEFLAGPTERTNGIWHKIQEMLSVENARGVYDVDYLTPSSITAHEPGYIDKTKELIVGLQTDGPLKRAIMPNGGWRMVTNSLKTYGYPIDETLNTIFTQYRKTHNDGVFDAYTPDIRAARSSHLITGLPDAYGRGRIIGDYRRVALYGVDYLIEKKKEDHDYLCNLTADVEIIQEREEHAEQIRALSELKEMAAKYGYDISKPAHTFQEAVQWLYFAYLASTKEQNGAAMSLGRTSTFLDIYAERDLQIGFINEEHIQEMIDDFVIKLRIIRFLRTPEYDELFSGDPTWVTETIGGMDAGGKTLVTKTSYRYLQTLYNLGAAPEPNLTVLWSEALPQNFKNFCAQVSIDTSAIQYESDKLISEECGDDAAIACCVSPVGSTKHGDEIQRGVGSSMQFFGARVNLVKALLYSINEGRDELSGKNIIPDINKLEHLDTLNYDEVWANFNKTMDWLAKTYVEALNVIHYMHDKYAYERIEMALHDREIERTLACGIAGLSVIADSLSAIKYAKVHPITDPETGLIVDYETEGEFPFFGNDDDSVDEIAALVTTTFMNKIREYKTYRNARHTMSLLTITSNVVYAKVTGNTPDGRRKGEPFAPGANPMNGRDTHGMVPSMLSLTKIPFADTKDGVSLTNTMIPSALGTDPAERAQNLAGVLDAGFMSGLYHANINVISADILLDAVDHPEKYPNLVVRVSGYAVNITRLTREQRADIASRTMHSK